jgi:uncharacterized membrane protein YeaQ/YmgE (transglycosylase-associated protein family)
VSGIDLSEVFGVWIHEVYLWTGFGTLVGLLARALMPGKDRAGALTTVLLGVGGAVIGSALLAYFWEGYHVTPLSPVGFCAAVAGAFILLLFHRLIGGYAFSAQPAVGAPQAVRRSEQDQEGE